MAETQTADTTQTIAGAEMNDGSNEGKELTTGQAAPAGPKTEAQKRKEKAEKVIRELSIRAETYKPLLQAHGIAWEIFVAVLQQAFVKVPSLLDCSTASILEAAFKCAKDGLMPDGDEAALTPFKKTATYVPGYKGMLKMAYAMEDGSGQKVYKDVDVDVIYEGEEPMLAFRKGTDPSLTFTPPLNRDIEKPVMGAYAVIRTNNGGLFIEVIGQKELNKIASVNKSTNGPRGTWGAEMHKKGPLRRLMKKTPKDQRLVQMLSHDEEAYIPGGSAAVDGDSADIPHEALFDDTRHVADHDPKTGEVLEGEIVQEGGEGQPVAHPVAAKIREDLAAAETEVQLDEVLANVKKTAKKVLPDEERALVLAFAEKLRSDKWPKEVEEEERPTTTAADTGTGGAPAAEPAPASSETAPPASTDGQAPKDSSPPKASEDTSGGGNDQGDDLTRAIDPAEVKAALAAAGGTAPSETNSYTANPTLRKGHTMAPVERRLSPQEALLDEEWGVHFKKGFTPNSSGQLPYFNKLGEIIGFAKDDLDIPWKEMNEGPEAKVAETAEERAILTSPPPPPPPASPPPPPPPPAAAPEPEGDDDGGYGAAEPEAEAAAPEGVRYLLKVKPTEPPREYIDPVEWRDALLYKINALNPTAGPLWWKDNKGFVEQAIATAKPQAGRVVLVAVTKNWPGAKDLVEQYGPFQ